jgi:predicted acyl esterase
VVARRSRLRFPAVRRACLAAVAAATVLLAWAGPAGAFSKQDLLLPMDDGAALAATLYLPDGAAPAGGWPAVILMHGLAQERSSMNTLAQAMGLVGEQYAVLTFDARGHGLSAGLIGIDGPREISDVRAVFDWLAARPDVADAKIGAWGISYGGGGALNSLAAGVPWAAVEVAETWSELLSALVPQGLAKSGVIGGFLTALPPAKVDPAVFAVRDAAFAGRVDEVRAFAAERSSLGRLAGNRTPVFLMQGRRDYAFGLDQATRLYAVLAGPKRLWIGNHGHPPSTFPAVDSAAMLAEGRQWFDRFLLGVQNGIERKPPVVLAREGRAQTVSYASLPPTGAQSFRPGELVQFKQAPQRTIAQSGRWVQQVRLRGDAEVFGSPTVRVRATVTGGWSRVVVTLSARTPAGREIAVSAGGVPAGPGTRTYLVALLNQATYVPAGSTWKVTVASSTLAQSPGNLMYLDLPMPATARLTVRSVTFGWPTLRVPVSR